MQNLTKALPSITVEHIIALWAGFIGIFGNSKMETMDGSQDYWLHQMQQRNVTPEQLRKGAKNVIDSGIKFPPGLGEFIALCQDQRPNNAMYRVFPKKEETKKRKMYQPGQTPAGIMSAKIKAVSEAEETKKRLKAIGWSREKIKPINDKDHARLMKEDSNIGEQYRSLVGATP